MIHIHRYDRQRDGTASGCIQLCANQTKTIAALGQTKTAFYFDTIRIICVCSLFLNKCLLLWSPKRWSGYPDIVSFAESDIFSVSVDLVYQHPLRITACPIVVSFYSTDQDICFVICIKGCFFEPCESLFIEAHFKLCAQFHWSLSPGSDFRPWSFSRRLPAATGGVLLIPLPLPSGAGSPDPSFP